MADQTLDSTPAPSDHPQSTPQEGGDPPPLTRNLSFSKLNAQAPEFVPMKTHPPPPPPPSAQPRLMIAPPPPPPPPAGMLHVAFPVPIRPHVAHMHHHHHPHPHHQPHHPPHQQQQQHGHHHHNQHQNHHHHHHNQQKHHQQESAAGQGQSQAQAQQDKDQGQGNGALRNGLSEEASQKLINQVEYYFSDVNLATTDHLIRFINKDPEGFVPISIVASFKKIKSLITTNSQLAAVLRNSTKLVVSDDGKKVKRLQALTGSDMEELQARIIVAENLPEDHCHQNLMKIFSAVGSVRSIRTCLPQPSNNGALSASRSSKNDNMHYSNKLHAFVEYESVELAEKAVAELNDEDDWRSGLRVRLLHKRGSKSALGRAKKSGNEAEEVREEDASTSEQNHNEKQPEDPSGRTDVHSHEHVEEQSLEKEGGPKKGRNRGRGKGRGRGQHHHQTHRGNYGSFAPMNDAVNNEHLVIAKQQPPGPRMPDGTRGFSMGRGKPLTVNTAA